MTIEDSSTALDRARELGRLVAELVSPWDEYIVRYIFQVDKIWELDHTLVLLHDCIPRTVSHDSQRAINQNVPSSNYYTRVLSSLVGLDSHDSAWVADVGGQPPLA